MRAMEIALVALTVPRLVVRRHRVLSVEAALHNVSKEHSTGNEAPTVRYGAVFFMLNRVWNAAVVLVEDMQL